MSLRLRLLAILGLSFTLLWSAASVWMWLDVRAEFRQALDERLAASAHMVAGLVAQLPAQAGSPSARPALDVLANEGVACEIKLLRGEIVARTRNSPPGLGQNATGFGTRTLAGQAWRSYTLQQGDVRITTADRLDRRQELLQGMGAAAVAPFLIAMLGSLLVLWFGTGKALAPLEAIRRAMARRTPEAMPPLPEAGLPAELAPLVQTLNLHLERTRTAMERERRFTGDAAHELRTPLTGVKTHLQVARLSAVQDREEALRLAEEGVQRLERVLEQLLALTRVEGRLSATDQEPASLQTILQLALAELPEAQRTRIAVEFDADADADAAEPEVRLRVPAVLAGLALRNLLDNALRYSPPASPVTLRVQSAAQRVALRVQDRGPGMPEAARVQAVQRFWRNQAGQGSGLGLSIAHAIAVQHGGSLRLSPGPQGGLEARLEFPRA